MATLLHFGPVFPAHEWHGKSRRYLRVKNGSILRLNDIFCCRLAACQSGLYVIAHVFGANFETMHVLHPTESDLLDLTNVCGMRLQIRGLVKSRAVVSDLYVHLSETDGRHGRGNVAAVHVADGFTVAEARHASR